MTHEAELVTFLDKYCERYRDYELDFFKGDELRGMSDIDALEELAEESQTICHDTSAFLNDNISKSEQIGGGDLHNVSDAFDVTAFLAREGFPTLLYFEQEDTYQTHSFVCLCIAVDRNYVVQSMGGLLAAHYDIYSDAELVRVLMRYMLGDTICLTGMAQVDTPTDYNSITGLTTAGGISRNLDDVIEAVEDGREDFQLAEDWAMSFCAYEYYFVPELPSLRDIEDQLRIIREKHIQGSQQYKPQGFLLDSRVLTQLESFLALQNKLQHLSG